jgi:hypothetical protein
MLGLPFGGGAAYAHPHCRLVGTTHEVPAYCGGHRWRFLRTPSWSTWTKRTSHWLDPDASREGVHLAWTPGHETCSAPPSVCSSWGEQVVHVCHGPHHRQAAWQLPRLCDSLGEAFEVSIGGGHLRGWSVVDGIRGSHDYRVSRGGSPDQHWAGHASDLVHEAGLSPMAAWPMVAPAPVTRRRVRHPLGSLRRRTVVHQWCIPSVVAWPMVALTQATTEASSSSTG